MLPTSPQPERFGPVPWGVAIALLATAAWLALAAPRPQVPRPPAANVALKPIPTGPRRETTGDPPTIVNGGFEHRCMECHRLFDSPPTERRTLTQHTEIKFQHGMNNRCFNCHDKKNREVFVLYDGTTIGFDKIPQLCSQCHGTVFRDWQRGMHGKTLGSWDASSGKQRRLTCNECHDPHSPAYPKYEPLRGPNTLRMGDQTHEAEHMDRHRPLRRWSGGQPHDEGHQGAPGHKGDTPENTTEGKEGHQ